MPGIRELLLSYGDSCKPYFHVQTTQQIGKIADWQTVSLEIGDARCAERRLKDWSSLFGVRRLGWDSRATREDISNFVTAMRLIV